MYARLKQLVAAVLWAAAAVGLACCCLDCLLRSGSVPGPMRLLYWLLIGFGAYAAWLCFQTVLEIARELRAGVGGQSGAAADDR